MKTEVVFSIYNVYSEKNPYFIYFDQTGSPFDGTLKVQGKQVSLFPLFLQLHGILILKSGPLPLKESTCPKGGFDPEWLILFQK
jgi:hypothetical protein